MCSGAGVCNAVDRGRANGVQNSEFSEMALLMVRLAGACANQCYVCKFSCAYLQFSFAFNVRRSEIIPGDKLAAQLARAAKRLRINGSFRSYSMSVFVVFYQIAVFGCAKVTSYFIPRNQVLRTHGTGLVPPKIHCSCTILYSNQYFDTRQRMITTFSPYTTLYPGSNPSHPHRHTSPASHSPHSSHIPSHSSS
jgi:hypothetical protein